MSDGRARSVRVGRPILAALAMVCALAVTAVPASAQGGVHAWDRRSAESLLAYIEHIDSHGLDPADYEPAELLWTIRLGDAAALERQATRSFAEVAGDLALGRVPPGRRGRYFIASDRLDPDAIAQLIDLAMPLGSVAQVLDRLAPQNRDYAALRAALVRLAPQEEDKRRKLEASLERWRWLPRELGEHHLIVNIPEYRLRLVSGERDIADHRVVVGKPSTPTPQFSAEVTAVILNPTWSVPQSIIAESVGNLIRTQPAVARARGYTWSGAGGRLQVTQQPGPHNALGQMKLEMANPLSVYIHDTPSKDLFERDQRAFSHGCIRTQRPLALAETLLADGRTTRAMIDAGVATRRTQRLALSRPIPVYVIYMTAVSDVGGTVRYLDDLYGLDAGVASQLR